VNPLDLAERTASSASSSGQFVALLRWPEEAATVDELRAAGTPRLLVVAPDAPPPEADDCDEDWIRLPASDDDVSARLRAVAARSARHTTAPTMKGDGRISFRGRWEPLGETEEAVAAALVARFGEVVDADTLARTVDPPMSGNAVRIQIMRLRTRLRGLGLEVRTVRSHGYVLEASRG
jgi:hypothetical protein